MRLQIQVRAQPFWGANSCSRQLFPGSAQVAELQKRTFGSVGRPVAILATTGLTHAMHLTGLDVSLFIFFSEPISGALRGTERYAAPCEQ